MAEAKLSTTLGGVCKITVHHDLPPDVLAMVMLIEDKQFRKDQFYSLEELEERSREAGFICFLYSLDGKPLAYDLGYNDEEKDIFFSDSSATVIERKGVGAILSVLEILYCFENGYKAINIMCEEIDQSGRRLKEYWGKFGYRVTKIDEKAHFVDMRLDLTSELVKSLGKKYIG